MRKVRTTLHTEGGILFKKEEYPKKYLELVEKFGEKAGGCIYALEQRLQRHPDEDVRLSFTDSKNSDSTS